jgi:pilus assembly protein CpaB
MADRRYTAIFAAALVTAAAATFGIYRVLEVQKAQNRIVTRPVVIALQDVAEGRSIERTSVTVANWPVGTVPAGAFSAIDSVVGRVARVDVFKGEVIVPGRLAPDGTGPGLQVKITPGKRAIAIRIDDVAGLNGLIQPNSRVDVMVTIRDESKNAQVSKLFMSNMRVLSVGTISQVSADNRPISAPTATLEVTPIEAERLAIAQGEGIIQLVLRGYGDPDSIKTEGAKSQDVLSQLRSPTSARAPEQQSRPAPRRTASNPALSTPAATIQAPPPPVVAPVVQAQPTTPKTPDSIAVQIFKGDKQEQRKFQKPDSLKPKPPAP